jgi:hypothetical protein
MLHRNNYFARAVPSEQDASHGGWRNVPTNCQAQDISKYRFALLRAISRNRAHGSTDGMADRSRVRRYRASCTRFQQEKAGGRVKGVRRHKASFVEWLTGDGRYRIGTATANDR